MSLRQENIGRRSRAVTYRLKDLEEANLVNDRAQLALAEEIVRAMKEHGVRPVREEGDAQAGWILLDYVDFVVHVFRQEERDYYRLENLWSDAPRLDWEEEAKASSG